MTVTLLEGTLTSLGPAVTVPAYDRRQVRVGIVHIGVGAFHRSHQAMYLDASLGNGHLDWGICGVGVLDRDTAIRDALAAQDGLYTLVTVAPDGQESARVIGSLVKHLHAPDDPRAVLDVLAAPTTRVVTLTITEGGYGVEPDGSFAPTDALTLADLGEPARLPASAFGLIVRALRMRHDAGLLPFTVLSCDNVQANGEVARWAILGMASRVEPDLVDWIANRVAFPNSMVDRITPVSDRGTVEAAVRFGIEDLWPVRAEAFCQWVIEDRFPAGRPPLEEVGVQFVSDVAPYEKMKLRLLNASHQAVGHWGLLLGYRYVHEACADPDLVRFLAGYLREEARPTLDPVPGIDLDDYCSSLMRRFASPAVEDTLSRLVVDASDRMTKFLLPVIKDRLRDGLSVQYAASVLAAWAHLLGPMSGYSSVDRQGLLLAEAVERDVASPGAFLDCPIFDGVGAHQGLRKAFVRSRRAISELGARGALRDLA